MSPQLSFLSISRVLDQARKTDRVCVCVHACKHTHMHACVCVCVWGVMTQIPPGQLSQSCQGRHGPLSPALFPLLKPMALGCLSVAPPMPMAIEHVGAGRTALCLASICVLLTAWAEAHPTLHGSPAAFQAWVVQVLNIGQSVLRSIACWAPSPASSIRQGDKYVLLDISTCEAQTLPHCNPCLDLPWLGSHCQHSHGGSLTPTAGKQEAPLY